MLDGVMSKRSRIFADVKRKTRPIMTTDVMLYVVVFSVLSCLPVYQCFSANPINKWHRRSDGQKRHWRDHDDDGLCRSDGIASKTALGAFTLTSGLEDCSLVSQTITSGMLGGVGDVLAQWQSFSTTQEELEAKGETTQLPTEMTTKGFELDMVRLIQFFAKGLGSGVIWAYWYAIADVWSDDVIVWMNHLHLLDVAISSEVAQRISRTVICILLEQFIACPLIFVLWDIPYPVLTGNERWQRIPLLMEAQLCRLLVANARLWTVANVLIYNIPMEWRTATMNVISIFWNSVVSSVTTEEVSLSS